MSDDSKITVLWAIVIGVTIGTAWYGFRVVAEPISKIIVAIIGAAAILLGAILTHALTTLREQKIELQRQRQTNYASILEKLTPYVRDPKRRQMNSPQPICTLGLSDHQKSLS
jgi:flagellar motor component MotA